MDQQVAGGGKIVKDKILLALEKGEVKITGALSEDSSGAIIRPGKGVEVYLNGGQVTGQAEVVPGDRVELKPGVEIEPDRVEIRISGDELKAEARYIGGKTTTYTVPDHPPTGDLTVDGVSREENLSTLTEGEIMGAVREQRISYGLDESVLGSLPDHEGEWQLIACGDAVQQGKDGRVETLFEGGVKSVSYADEESRVDFRKRFEIVQVNEGDVIALIHPPTPGIPGRSVTGRELHPDPVKKAEVNCEGGAVLSSDQKQVLAACRGVPAYKKGRMHSFRVDDIYIHQGDIDIKSGNIDFRGHFKVQGAVTEGMKVSADGNIEIGDNAAGSKILAGGSIVFKGNCIKCTVQAGWVDLVLKETYNTLDRMEESINNALAASEEVARALEAKGRHSEQMESAVIRALLQSKFTELPEYAGLLMKSLKDAGRSLPQNLVETIKDIAPYFIDFQYSQGLGRPVLYEIRNRLSALHEGREIKDVRADITAPYVQNSILLCTGDIIIPGPGAYNSKLSCSGEVNISRLFRGGTIEAGGDVYIGEAGTPRITADQGLVAVPSKSRVHLGVAYENIRIRFGITDYRCEKNLQNVIAILDQQDYEVKVLPWENTPRK